MNFSYLPKNKFSILLLSVVFLSACQSLRTRDEVPAKRPTINPSAPVVQPIPQLPGHHQATPAHNTEIPDTPVVQSPTPMPDMPRIGVILSGGGARAYAHIGFLQELAKLKIPIHAIAGIEFGAPIAALYANKELANDVEWQMFKIKEDDVIKKSFLSSGMKPVEITVLSEFIKTNFSRLKVEDFKLPFACPAFNMAKNSVYVMSRGTADSLLPYCWPYPPLFKPYKSNVSAIREVKMLADYLRSKGANYVIFVNALAGTHGKSFVGDATSIENILWSEIAADYSRPIAGVNAVISLGMDNYSIIDFDKRREIMQKGAESANKNLKALGKRWGL